MRVLLIDSNERENLTLAKILKRYGHEVRTATTAADGLAAALILLPDVIYLDLLLPDGSGYDLAQQIRQHPELLRTTLAAHSALPLNEARAHSCGIGVYLRKPTLISVLAETACAGMSKAHC